MGRPVNGITGSAGVVVDVELAADVELLDDELVLASVAGADAVVGGVVAKPAVVAELEPSLLLQAASASAASTNVEICLEDFTGSQRSRCARRAGGGAQHCYRMATETGVIPL
jgi:hypothetical protein